MNQGEMQKSRSNLPLHSYQQYTPQRTYQTYQTHQTHQAHQTHQTYQSQHKSTIYPSYRSLISTITFYVTLFLLFYPIFSNALKPFNPILSCPPTSYFDSTSLKCEECPTDAVPTSSITRSTPLSLTSANGFGPSPILDSSCTCAPGFEILTSSPLTCNSCLLTNQAAWSDASGCTTCGAGSALSLTPEGDCVCTDPTHILVELDQNGDKLTEKVCMACPANSAKHDAYNCKRCPDPTMTTTGTGVGIDTCTCPTGSTFIYMQCFPDPIIASFHSLYSPSSYNSITYYDVLRLSRDSSSSSSSSGSSNTSSETVTVSSHVLATRFLYHALRCQDGRYPQSCHAIVNMCVAVMYDKAHPACKFHIAISSSNPLTNYDFPDWHVGHPWLYYADSSVLLSDAITTKLRLSGMKKDSSTTNAANDNDDIRVQSRLQYMIVSYNFDGELLHTKPLTNELILCTAPSTGNSIPSSASASSSATSSSSFPSAATLETDNKFLEFGSDAKVDCKVDLSLVLQSHYRDLFHEIYFIDTKDRWFPIPVKPLGYIGESNTTPNKKKSGKNREIFDRANIRLVRRFTISDALFSIPDSSSSIIPPSTLDSIHKSTTLTNSMIHSIQGKPDVFRYASQITIRVTIRDGSQDSIYPPLLVIDHTSRRPSDFEYLGDISSGSILTEVPILYPPIPPSKQREFYTTLSKNMRKIRYAKVVFKQEYRNNIRSLEITAIVFFALTIVACFVVWVVKVLAWQRRERIGISSATAVLRIIAQCVGTYGEGLFWLMFFTSFYIFVFFKSQEEAHVLLPSKTSILSKSLTPMLIFTFIGLLLDIIHRLVYQVSIDVMLIDWEAKNVAQKFTYLGTSSGLLGDGVSDLNSTTYDVNAELERAALLGMGLDSGMLSTMTSGTMGGDGSGSSIGAVSSGGSISAWRRVLIANKWLEVQNTRRFHIPLTLFTLLLLLHAIGLENLATAQPVANNLDPFSAPLSPILRFFVTSLLWLCIGGTQIIIQFVILDVLLPPPTVKFIDLLASTNISLCVFDHRYHMFYLHGKSVHERVDVDFVEMNMQASRERRNFVHPRGLRGDVTGVTLGMASRTQDQVDENDTYADGEGEASFSVFISPELRSHYDIEYASLLYRHILEGKRIEKRIVLDAQNRKSQFIQQENNRVGTGGVGVGNDIRNRHNTMNQRPSSTALQSIDVIDAMDTELARSQARMNRFLCEFIEKSLPGHKYEIVKRGYFASWLDLPPVIERKTPGLNIFTPDPAHSIKRTLMYGLDNHLLIFYCILHASCDALFNNTIVSLLVVYAFDFLFTSIRSRLSRINISRKAVINERYLL